MSIPDWWEFVLLSLISYRAWRLIAQDDILDRPRNWILRLPRNWDGDERTLGPRYRNKLALFLRCPWCAGAWISAFIYLVWLSFFGDPDFTSDVILGALGTWFALSATVGLIRTNLDPPED